jgi:uncharacterized membrane protein
MYPDSMRNFETNKILGGVGALFTAIGSLVLFQGTVGIVGLVGLILLLISMHGLSEDFKDYGIFRRAVGGFIFGLIGTLIAVAVLSLFSFLGGFFFSHLIIGSLVLAGAIVGWIVMFIFFVLSGIFYRLAFYSIADKSRLTILRTGAIILLVGSALTVVLAGFVLMFVGWLLIAVGLFSLRLPEEQMPPSGVRNVTPSPTTGASSDQVKYCPNCGAENKLNGTFCTRCGKRLNPQYQ